MPQASLTVKCGLGGSGRLGLTLVELLVVCAVISLLLALLFPAVQLARELSRNASCTNNLRQVGLAFGMHEAAQRHFPSAGWGFRWVGDPDRPSGRAQPGGWSFALLPYLDAKSVYDLGRGVPASQKANALGKMLQMPVAVLSCPTRRKPALTPFLGQYPLANAVKPGTSYKSDYAACAGDKVLANNVGPADDSPRAVAIYKWPTMDEATGIIFAGSSVRIADVTDGLGTTYLVAEKYVRIGMPPTPDERDFGDDQAAYMGDDRDSRRWAADSPRRDTRYADSFDTFGSPHPSTWNALFADGSVRSIHFAIDVHVHRTLGNRHDGGPVNPP